MNVVCSNTKQIGKLSKLKDKLIFQQSMHSFESTVCLSEGVPIETISQMMGHRNIKTKQIYMEITGAKIEQDMQLPSEKIKEDYQLKR